MIRVGSLFSGYGGLDMAVHEVLGGETAWVSDVCKVNKDGGVGHYEPHRSPCTILEHRFGVPNLGDITQIKWTPDCPTCGDILALYWTGKFPEGRGYYCPRDGWFSLNIWDPVSGVAEPVDVLCGGFPCQDVSTAGKRAGLKPGTRSGLWSHFAYAIDQLRPSLVLIENVRGLLSADAHSDLVDRPQLLADLRRRDGEPVLRALGAVLGDLAELGYDAAWVGLRAADVGACHGRFRVFIAAHPSGGQLSGPAAAGDRLSVSTQRGLRADAVTLLPTPAVNDMGEGKTVEAWDEWTDAMQAKHGNGNGHGKSLAIEAQRLLPTPRVKNNENEQSPGYGGKDGNFHGLLTGQSAWGDYAQGIAQWEALTRPAPAPTELSAKGAPRLSPRFVEWMMGLPDGWITGVPGITRNEALKACGNGVVPQQAAAAFRWLLDVMARAA